MEIEEELIPDLTVSVYRRTVTLIYLPRSQSPSVGGYEVAAVDPLDLEAALQRDAEMIGDSGEGARKSIPVIVGGLHACKA